MILSSLSSDPPSITPPPSSFFVLLPYSIPFLSIFLFSSGSPHLRSRTEEVELISVNRDNERVGPDCFELLTVLGKGGYGKVCAYAWAFMAVRFHGSQIIFTFVFPHPGLPGEESSGSSNWENICHEGPEKGTIDSSPHLLSIYHLPQLNVISIFKYSSLP